MKTKTNFTTLLIMAVLVCMLTACGADSGAASPGVTPRQDETNQSPEPGGVTGSGDSASKEDITGEGQADSEPEPTATPEPQVVSITISAAGDASLGNYYGQGYSGSFRETYSKVQDFSYFLENVYDIFSTDDMTIVNLEGTLTMAEERRPNHQFCISGDPEYVNILTAGSVEAVSMANNHRMDYLQQGTEDTVKTLEEAGIPYAFDQYTGTYETSQGILVGFVSVNEVEQGTEVETYLEEGIKELQDQGCDLILACCHWGYELDYYPREYQKTLGRKCIDWGADLVIGHHPHVLQGVEEYQGKYIVYSLGNFCFGANKNPKDKDTFIVQQTFTFIDGVKQEETQLKVIPCSISSVTNRNDYRPTPAEGDEAARILEKINECSKDLGVQFDEEGFPINP